MGPETRKGEERAIRHYDAIVIGSGQDGKPLASALAGAGHRTGIIEQEHVGGSCANVGFMPTKTMIASARAAYDIYNGPVTVDMAAVRQRKRYMVHSEQLPKASGRASRGPRAWAFCSHAYHCA